MTIYYEINHFYDDYISRIWYFGDFEWEFTSKKHEKLIQHGNEPKQCSRPYMYQCINTVSRVHTTDKRADWHHQLPDLDLATTIPAIRGYQILTTSFWPVRLRADRLPVLSSFLIVNRGRVSLIVCLFSVNGFICHPFNKSINDAATTSPRPSSFVGAGFLIIMCHSLLSSDCRPVSLLQSLRFIWSKRCCIPAVRIPQSLRK